MTRIEKATRKAAENSPSIKKLIDLQDAYIHATKKMHNSEEYVDTLVYQSCRYAIQCHAIWMAEKLNSSMELRKAFREDESFPWHEVIYVFVDKVPAIGELIAREIEPEI